MNFVVSYVGGDGNDVVLFTGTPDTNVDLTGGVLTISDINSETADGINISFDGTYYVITDPNSIFSTTNLSGANVTRPDARTVRVLASAVTSLNVVTAGSGAAADTVTINSLPASIGGAVTISAETINLNTSVASTGNQTYNGAVVLGNSVELAAGDVFLNGTVAMGANNLTVEVTGTAGTSTGGISGSGQLIKQGAGTFALTGTGNNTNTYNGLTHVQGGTLNVGGSFAADGAIQGNVTIDSGATLRLTQSEVIANGSDFIINGTLNMNGQSEVLGNIQGSGAITNHTNNGTTGLSLDDLNGTHTFSGNISGGGALNLRGNLADTGTLELSGGTVALGNLRIGDGTLTIKNNAAVTTGITTVGTNLTGQITGITQASVSATLNIESGTLTTVGIEAGNRSVGSVVGLINQTGGTVTTTGQAAEGNGVRLGHYPNSNITYNLSGGTLSITNGFALSTATDGTGKFTQTGGVVNATSVDVNSRAGAGGSGTFEVLGGTFNLGSGGITHDSDASVATVNLGGLGGTIFATAASTSTAAATFSGAGVNAINIDTNGFDMTVSGNLSGAGGLDKLGSGILTLSGTNTYAGDTFVVAGTLLINGAHTGPVVSDYRDNFRGTGWQYLWNSGGAIGTAANYTPMIWNGSNTYTVTGGALPGPNPGAYVNLTSTGGHPGQSAGQSGNTVDRHAIAAYTVATAGAYVLNGSSLDPLGAAGDGNEVRIYVNDILKASYTCDDTAIGFNTDLGQLNAGDVVYVTSGPDGSGAGNNDGSDSFSWDFTIAKQPVITVQNGATLGGAGSTTAAVTVTSGGFLNAGLASGDTTDDLGSGTLVVSAGSTYAVRLDSTTVNTGYDQVDVTGTVTLGGNLQLTAGFTPAAGDTFIIIDNDLTDAVTGTFSGLVEGATVTAGGQNFVISYVGGTGNDVVLFAGTPDTNVDLTGGVLTISDINSETADGITISFDGTYYVITDPNAVLSTSNLGGANVTRPDSRTVRVLASAVTSLNVVTAGAGAAADTVTINTLPASIGGAITISAETINLNTSVTSIGDQTYNGTVQLGANVTTAGQDVTFNGTVNGAFGLTVNTSGSGVTTFAGAVGAVNALTSLTTNADGTLLINGGAVTTTGAQSYAESVTLGASATLTATNINLTGTTVNLAAHTLTVNVTGTTSSITGMVSGNGGLNKNGTGTLLLNGVNTYLGLTNLNSGTLDLDGSHTGGDIYTLLSGTTLTGAGFTDATIDGRAGSAIVTDGNLTLGDLSVNAFATDGTITVGVGHTLTLRDSGLALLGSSTLVNGILAAANGLSMSSGDLLSGGGTVNAVVNVNSGTVSPGQVGGDITQTLNVGSIDLGPSSGTGTFRVDLDGTVNGDLLDVTGTVDLVNSALDVNTATGLIPASTILVIRNDSTDAVTGTFNGMPEGAAVTDDGNNYVISYRGGDGNDVVLFVGTAETNVAIDGSGNLVVTDIGSNSTDNLTITLVNVAGTDYYQIVDSDPARVFSTTGIASSSVLRPNASTVLVAVSAVTGGLTAGTSGNAVETFTIASPLNLAGAVNLTASVINLNVNITSVGDQTYTGAVRLGVDLTLAGQDVTFNGTVDGARNLIVNTSGSGVTTFGGAVGGTTALTSLTTNADGSVAINGGGITTSGDQTYNENVTLGANTVLGGTSVIFNGSIAGSGNDLTINATTTALGNASADTVSGIGTLTTDAGGTTTITAGTVGATTVTLNDNITLGSTLAITATTVSFNGNITGGGNDLTINATTTALGNTFADTVSGIGTLTTDAAGTTTITAGAVSGVTLLFQDNVTLGASTELTGSTSVTFNGNITGGGNNLTVNSPTSTFGNASSDTISGVGTLLTDAAGTTTINSGSVSATTVTLNDNMTLGSDVVITATTATFNGNITGGGNDLTINATTTTFGDAPADSISGVDTLTTNAAGTTTINAATVSASSIDFNDTVILTTNVTLTATNLDLADAEGPGGLTADVSGTTILGGDLGSTTSPLAFLDIVSGGPISIANEVNTAGTVTLTTAGNFTFAVTGTMTSGGAVTVNGDQTDPGVNDPDLAGTTIIWAGTVTAPAVTLISSEQDDVFVVTPSVTTPITVNGDAPSILPGDILSITDLTSVVTVTPPGAGTYTTPGMADVDFTGIERDNQVPQLDNLHLTDITDIIRNPTTTLSGTIRDVGPLTEHTLTINWGDGSVEVIDMGNPPAHVSFNPATGQFAVTHTYAVDGIYNVTVETVDFFNATSGIEPLTMYAYFLKVGDAPGFFTFIGDYSLFGITNLFRDLSQDNILEGFRFAQPGGLFNEDGNTDRNRPILTLIPTYTGAASPGSVITIRIMSSNGEFLPGGSMTVVADLTGNWMAGFSDLVLGNSPYFIQIEEQPASWDSSMESVFRTFFAPAIGGSFNEAEILSPNAILLRRLSSVAMDILNQINRNPQGTNEDWRSSTGSGDTAGDNAPPTALKPLVVIKLTAADGAIPIGSEEVPPTQPVIDDLAEQLNDAASAELEAALADGI